MFFFGTLSEITFSHIFAHLGTKMFDFGSPVAPHRAENGVQNRSGGAKKLLISSLRARPFTDLAPTYFQDPFRSVPGHHFAWFLMDLGCHFCGFGFDSGFDFGPMFHTFLATNLQTTEAHNISVPSLVKISQTTTHTPQTAPFSSWGRRHEAEPWNNLSGFYFPVCINKLA